MATRFLFDPFLLLGLMIGIISTYESEPTSGVLQRKEGDLLSWTSFWKYVRHRSSDSSLEHRPWNCLCLWLWRKQGVNESYSAWKIQIWIFRMVVALQFTSTANHNILVVKIQPVINCISGSGSWRIRSRGGSIMPSKKSMQHLNAIIECIEYEVQRVSLEIFNLFGLVELQNGLPISSTNYLIWLRICNKATRMQPIHVIATLLCHL